MTARHLLSLGVAAGALSIAAPVLAQAPVPPPPAPAPPYEYAEPGSAVVFENDPVIQPVPVPPSVVAAPHAQAQPVEPEYEYEYEYERQGHAEPMAPAYPMAHPGYPAATHPLPAPHVMHHGPVIGAPMAYGHPGAHPVAPYPYPPQHAGWAPPPRFDREAWLEDCRMRIRGVDRRERGGVIGGLLGAIGGGIAGNRIADGERLAGTLIGAGVGGLAGIAIGAAIGAAADRKRVDECELHLDRYLTDYRPGPAYGYGYPAYTYTYVPVIVPVPQRAVVREYVTTEWVEVPAPPARAVSQPKIIRQPAPAKVAPVERGKVNRGR